MCSSKISKNPDHKSQLASINRAIGQLEAAKKLIINQEYCPKILYQVKAARGALKTVEVAILGTHIDSCVHEAALSKDPQKIEEKISEISKYIRNFIK